MLNKLITLVVSIFLIIAAGTANYYPLYLSGIMKRYSYSEKQVNLYASFINLGFWLTLPQGFLFDRYGPGICLIIACILLPGSYTILNLLLTMVKTKLHIIPMIILGFMMGQGGALCYMSAITTNIKNFMNSANVISGILITNLAISPSLFTSYESAMKNKSKSDYEFIVFIGLSLAGIIAIGAWLVQVQEGKEEANEEKKKFMTYKEHKICGIFVGLNLFTLFIFITGIILNNRNSTSKFPVAYLFPVVQVANVIMILLERCGFWDCVLMKFYIKKEIKKRRETNEKNFWDKVNSIKDSNATLTKIKMNEPINELKKENKMCQIKEEKKEEEKDDKISLDIGSEKAIIDNKKLNLSFDIDKRINELKVKYELNTSNEDNFYSKKATEGTNNPIPNNINQSRGSFPQIEKREGYIETIQSNKSNTCNGLFCNLFCSPDLIMVTIIMMFGVGSSMSVNHNIGQVLLTINPKIKPGRISDYSIIYFAFDSFSRLISGPLLNQISHRNYSKEYLLLISIGGLISQLIGLSMNSGAMYATITLAGIVNGLSMTFIPMFVKENNETKDYGKILGTLITGVAFGTMLISDFIFKAFYEAFKEKNGKCYGNRCFIYSFVVNSLFFLINIILSIVAICGKRKRSKEENRNKKVFVV